MKKKVVLTAALLMLTASVWSIFHYVSRDGEFEMWAYPTAGAELLDGGQAIYMGYSFDWEGLGSPTLEDIQFHKRDGTIVQNGEDEFHVRAFVDGLVDKDHGDAIGIMDEETVVGQGMVDDLVPYTDYQVEDEFILVLRVEFNGSNIDNDIEELQLTYKKFGVTQHQTIQLANGIIEDE
ncbi:MAG TPA: hypothetical protein VK947_03240 [Planococcus sp. (in: firmicutes)]|nr:hypothetical protein [Planococcus sp. (in: firmicutes)]